MKGTIINRNDPVKELSGKESVLEEEMVWYVPGSGNVLLYLSEQKRTENNLSQEKAEDRLNMGRSLEIVIIFNGKANIMI